MRRPEGPDYEPPAKREAKYSARPFEVQTANGRAGYFGDGTAVAS